MYKIAKENLQTLYREIAKNQELFLPEKIGEQVNFAPYREELETDLTVLKTVKSPKDVFFPQSENLYTCVEKDRKITIEPEKLQEQKFVVFGMRPCDVKGVQVLDKVFLADPETAAEGLVDVAAWFVEDTLYLKAVTEKGTALLEAVKDVLTEAENTDEAKVEAQKETVRAIVEKLPYTHLSLEGWNGDDMMERFNSPVWEELYHPCLACGTCTFVCPTCQCYDIKDYDTGHGIQRYRCWDSCMYSDFTMMAHGNNRNSQMQRFRQRFMHKLVYFPANNNGMYSCVGCGRCVEKCPSSLNIVKVIKAFEKQGGAKE